MRKMFRGGLLVIIAACGALAPARSSPQVNNNQESLKNVDARYSDDVFEDANLDVPGLITKYRYPIEVYNVTTEDGYILQMHRIPYGRDANNVATQRKPVVFVMHGLLCSSADFVLMGPGSGLDHDARNLRSHSGWFVGKTARPLGQGIAEKGFRRYDQGSALANYVKYGSTTPPSYDLSKVTAPVFLHYSESDPLAEVEDVDTLFEELVSTTVSRFLVPLSSFSHIDFMYGVDAKELVYDNVIDLINAMDAEYLASI